MSRLFLSGQTTCALLLGAGLLLRAQAALRSEPTPSPQQAARSAFEREEPARAAVRELDGRPPARLARPLRGPIHALRAAEDQVPMAPREEHAASHPRKRRVQGRRSAHRRAPGSAVAPAPGRAAGGRG